MLRTSSRPLASVVLRGAVACRTPSFARLYSVKSCIPSSLSSATAVMARYPTTANITNTPAISPSLATPTILISRRSFASYPSHVKVGMPALSPTMTQGNIAKWRKKEGEQIKVGDVVAEIETDKATMDFESQEEGYLAKILMPEGSRDVPINTPIAVVVDSKADASKFTDYTVEKSGTDKKKEEAAPPPKKEETPKETPAAAPAAAPKSNTSASYPPHNSLSMPALSPTMTQGNLNKWRKKEGDAIKSGDILAEIETDKASMELEATEDGFLARILVQDGARDIPINTPIAIIANSKDDVGKFKDYSADSASKAAPASSGESKKASESSEAAAPSQSSAPATPASSTRKDGSRLFVSPLARKTASDSNVDLSSITGTGPSQRIIKSDVLAAASRPTPSAASTATAQIPAPSGAAKQQQSATDAIYEDIPTTQIRRVIAQRLTMSKQTIPHYYLTMECRVDELMKVRTQLNAKGEGKNGYKLSVNDFVIKAAAQALRRVPTVNASWNETAIRQFRSIDINVAVSTDRGLFTPFIRDADTKGLATIASQVKDLAEKAKAGKLAPDQLQGGTFTISNLGMYGIKSFSAVINPPQAAILAVGSAEKRLIPSESAEGYEVANILTVTLSCDHRVVDGAVGAEWLQAFKDYIENPLKLML